MNWQQVEGRWDEVKGHIQKSWGKLTDSDLREAQGRRDQIVGKIRQRYGEKKEEIGAKLDELIDRI